MDLLIRCFSKVLLTYLPVFGHLMELWSHREVKSAGGKGKGVPQSLRALSRVLSCTTVKELNHLVMEAAQTDGRLARRPLQDMNKEIQAHKMLSSFFIQLIAEHNAAIMSLDSCDSSSLSERLPVRRQMARDLLHGELHILKSASTWLENYCFSLTWWSVNGYSLWRTMKKQARIKTNVRWDRIPLGILISFGMLHIVISHFLCVVQCYKFCNF